MPYTELQWRDGTPYNAEFDDIYHSSRGSESQAMHVFVQGNDLIERFAAMPSQGSRLTIAETGFGTALNFIVTVRAFLEHAAEGAHLDFISVDRYLIHPDHLRELAAHHPELSALYDELLAHYPPAVDGIHRIHLLDGRIRLTLMLGEASDMLASLSPDTAVDAWFLDGFSPAINPDMWDGSILEQLARLSAPSATLATYTIAGDVRRGLQQQGIEVSRRDGYANKRDMLVARYQQARAERSSAPWFALPQHRVPADRVVIVGAGIAGLLTARALVHRGYRVMLVDRHAEVAAGASGNPAALVMPRFSINDEDDRRFQLQALLYAIGEYERIQRDADEELWFGSGVESAMEERRVAALFQDRRYAEIAEASTRSEIEEGMPWFRYRLAGWCRPDRLCAELLRQLGDDIECVTAELARIETHDGGHRLFAAEGSLIADTAVLVLANAAGLRSIDGLPEFPLTSNLGQISTLETQASLPAYPLAAGAYATPCYEGRLTTGATYRHDLSQTGVLEEDHRFNLDKLHRLHPELLIDEGRLTGRVSERANMPDRVPMVGALPDTAWFETAYAELHHGRPASNYPRAQHVPGLYLNIAHGSRGFTTAPLCGEIIASLIDATPAPVCQADLARLNPARFIVRRLKKSPADTI